MASTRDNTKRKRAAQTGVLVGVRLQPDLLSDLDAFIGGEPNPKPSRPDAIRRLLSDALIGMGLRKVQ